MGGPPEPAADIAKNMGIEIFSFGIGRINRTQLENIANRPVTTHVFIARNFQPDELVRFVGNLTRVTCRGNTSYKPSTQLLYYVVITFIANV